jgi:hyperosmotically inducible periplasmic protein
MRAFILGLILGLIIGAGGFWYLGKERANAELVSARDKVVNGAGKVKDSIQEKIGEIKTEDIREELNRTGMIVREKTKKAGQAIADATANARITASIKSKLIAEPGISALSINVDTTDGLVTLSGTAKSEEEVAKAVRIALETEGVHKVVSTLQVKPGN